MTNFYDEWLGLWGKNVEERARARKVLYPEELQWVKTRQDARAALLVAPENGFRTSGGVTMLAEIPEGWKTGRHSHGEEAMYIVRGRGFSIIDERRFNWEEGSCLKIPFGAVHQHFNAGDEPVLYFSAMAVHLERMLSVAKFQQFEDCGSIEAQPKYEESGSDFNGEGTRVVLHMKDAAVGHKGEHGLTHHRPGSIPEQMYDVQHSKNIRFMGARQDFKGDEVQITGILADEPHTCSEKHAHMEAILYVLQGEGFSIVDGEKIPWRQGSCLHIQGPQTVHQHFNTGNVESRHLRTHFEIRNEYEPLVKKTFPYLYFEAGRPLQPG